MDDSSTKVMTAQEVAAYLRLDTETVYRYRKKLGGIKIGGVLRFRRSDIEAGIWNQVNTPGQEVTIPRQHFGGSAKSKSSPHTQEPVRQATEYGPEDDPYGLVSGPWKRSDR